MHTFTDEQKAEIANKAQYIETKEKLLKKYKDLGEALDFAIDDVEKGLAEEKREQLAIKIKSLSAKVREIEAMEKRV